jgi:hypothetical protein
VRHDIPRAFESEDYARRRRETLAEITQRRDALFDQLQDTASEQGFAIEMTSSGIVTIPLQDGKPLSDEEFEHLPEQS